jgi:hypothetical protein
METKMIEDYLLWKRDKELYPPQWTPAEWARDVIMSEANVRINLLKDMLEDVVELDPMELANEIHKIVYDPIEELMSDGGLQVQEEA